MWQKLRTRALDGMGNHDESWDSRLLAIGSSPVNEAPCVKPGRWSVTARSTRVGETYVARHEFAYTEPEISQLGPI